MITYKYTARDAATGKYIEGTVTATDERAVAVMVKGQGYSLLSVEADEPSSLLGFLGNKIKTKDKVVFSRQMSTLIDAGLPLMQSLRSVQEQTKNKSLQNILNQVISDVEGGKNFSESLAKHPKVFNKIFVSLVEAGEASGTLDVALERLANQQEKEAELASKVRGAMVYPIIVLFVMAGVVIFMLVSVLPSVEELYAGIAGARLPLLTRVLLVVSDAMIRFWWVLLIVLGIGVFLGSRWARTVGGKRFIDIAKLKMWPIGPLFSKMYMARFARTGATLVSSGVPLIQTLDITAHSVNNVYVEESINAATEKVRGGKSLATALEGDLYFIDLVPKMLKIGEDSGAMEQMMEKTADYFEKEVDQQVKSIQTIIEPVLMIILGIVAITIVSAILLPIYGLVGQKIV